MRVWKEHPHHLQVPRNFLSVLDIARLPFPVYDLRFKDFPAVSFGSRVTLDAQNPDKTFQREGSSALHATYDGILTLRCGAGKTVVALHTASLLEVPIMIVVDEKALGEQWREAIQKYLGLPESDIGTYKADIVDWEKPICIAMVQTLAKRALDGVLPPEMTKFFGVAIFDETHCMGAPYFNNAGPIFHGRRWGLSATPEREDEYDSLLRYTIGRVVYSYLIPETKPLFIFEPGGGRYPTGKGMKEITVGNKVHHGKLYGYLSTLENRNARIAKVVRAKIAEGRQILILSNSKAMIKVMAKELEDLDPGVAHGDVTDPVVRRAQISEHNPVLATMRIGKQALDKDSLDTLVLCDPITKDGVLQQTMGRILRLRADKLEPEVIVFEDHDIQESRGACQRIRTKLTKWPAHKGGAIKYVNRKYKTNKTQRGGRIARKARTGRSR